MTAIDIPRTPSFSELFQDDVFRIETRRLWLRWPATADDCAALFRPFFMSFWMAATTGFATAMAVS